MGIRAMGWLMLVAACGEATPPPVEATPQPAAVPQEPVAQPPSPRTSAAPVDAGKLVVSISADGTVLVGARVATEDDVVAAAKQRAVDPSARIYFEVDASVDFYRVVRVIELMKQGGIHKFAFLVRRTGEMEILPHDLPRAERLEDDHVVGIEAGDGSVTVDGKPMRTEEIGSYIRMVTSKHDKVRVVLRAPRGAAYGRIIELYRMLREAGVSNPVFGIEPSR